MFMRTVTEFSIIQDYHTLQSDCYYKGYRYSNMLFIANAVGSYVFLITYISVPQPWSWRTCTIMDCIFHVLLALLHLLYFKEG